MGCGYDVICRTCRRSYYVGYGSYSTWVIVLTLREFNEKAAATPDLLDRAKNQRIQQVLQEHDGHDLYFANGDYHSTDRTSGALTGQFGTMGADVVVIPDYAEYEHVDLAPNE